MEIDIQTSDKVTQKVIDILLNVGYSTTKLLEILTGKTLEVNVIEQGTMPSFELPDEYRELLSCSNTYMKRIVSLHSKSNVFSDNIVIASWDLVSEDIKKGLLAGKTPLGKLTQRHESKRVLLWSGILDAKDLYGYFNHKKFTARKYPVKKYLLYVDNSCWFYLLEVFHIDEIVKAFWE